VDECKPLAGGAVGEGPAVGSGGAGHGGVPGRAVQVDPIKPTLKPPGTKRLKLKFDVLLSTFAFKINLRRYNLGIEEVDSVAVKRVARLAVSAPLPPGWTESTDDGGEPIFKNDSNGNVQEEHPLDGYFIELVRRHRQASVTGEEARGWPGNLAEALNPARASGPAAAPTPAEARATAAAAAAAAAGAAATAAAAAAAGTTARSPRNSGSKKSEVVVAEGSGAGAGPRTPTRSPGRGGAVGLTPEPSDTEVLARAAAAEAKVQQRMDGRADTRSPISST